MPNTLHRSLETLFRELIDGPDAAAAWMLNGGDVGLLRSIDKLSAEAASSCTRGRNRDHRSPCRSSSVWSLADESMEPWRA